MNYQEFFVSFLSAFIEKAISYGIFAIPFFVVFWIIWKRKFQRIRIQEVQTATKHHFKHDLAHSASTFFVFAVMDVALLYLHSQGYTLLYLDINQYGWPWALISLVLLLFIGDTYFYWSHRVMHHPKLYKFFHRVHHESTDPSPLTAFSFHPSEAIVENLQMFVLPFIMPLHFGVILIYQVFDMLNNVLAHLGYEAYPKGWVQMPILKYKTVSTHHNMHHQRFNGNYALYFTWWDKWMGTEFKDYEVRHEQIFERKKIKKSSDGLYILSVSNIRPEANDAFTIQFDNVPAVFRDFSAGQHVTIKVDIQGETLYRTFSISSFPNVDNFFTLTIRKIHGGKVTNHLAENLKVGDTLEVTPPSGQFYLNPEPARQKHYVMIAGGSGITPIHSMIGAILKVEPKSKITLFYANRNSNTIIFKERLEKWATEFPSRLEVKHFLIEVENPQYGIKGFVNRYSLQELVNRCGKEELDFYLCGSERVTNKLIENLDDLGIDKQKIHRELFVITSQNQVNTSQKAQVSATVFGKQYQFETTEGKTILQSGVEQNIPLPFSCQRGLCGTCKMKCTEGKVIMKNNQVLSEQDLKAGYILTCQSLPQTERITIEN
jgi:ring-1,2-phenylacetyl-CoA epoxidase subunit PaaE